MKQLTYQSIKDCGPCYDPVKYIPKDWQGTALDILSMNDVSIKDRLWVVLRASVLPKKTLQLFAIACAENVKHLMKDERSLIALQAAKDFVNGKISSKELNEKRDAAYAAAAAANAAANAAAAAATYATYAAAAAADADAAAAANAAANAAADAARQEEREHQLIILKNLIMSQET